MADFDQDMQCLLLSLKASDVVRGKLSQLGLTTVHLLAAVGDEDLTTAFSSKADTVTTRTTAFALKAAAKLVVSMNDDVVPLPGQPDALLRSLVEACPKTVKDGPPPEFLSLPRHMKRLYVAPLTYSDFAESVPPRNQTPASAIRYEVSLDGSVVAVQNNNKPGKIGFCSDW
ncbi:hypothetical protein Pmar_PMAR011615 [Perkinsus marinus ATCC 50983]|uniref:Uncharacterized protein n=1 Tax=Perkinsus marinus (strain ATCC 50983 / TXsc) TaxID=423536 RepID=C5LCA1_PERM5|nr:hypothetical protein Pmar_PMAR011615 [Perkinsus marinus ATCC 50983]EER05584.1 hypothetical protein Pmar_PMAR011615 [Perkinsus marinus ATCC 50983]|eukprot:XP_002773768.1 hypothetical protein Pmar_PMAR011615 [Perkinsus marinus ATCC 50983]